MFGAVFLEIFSHKFSVNITKGLSCKADAERRFETDSRVRVISCMQIFLDKQTHVIRAYVSFKFRAIYFFLDFLN